MPNICMVYWHVYELIQGDGTLSTGMAVGECRGACKQVLCVELKSPTSLEAFCVSADDVDCDLSFSHQINHSLFTTHKCDTLYSMFKFISLSLILLDLLWQQQQWQWLKVVKNVGWWVGAKVHVILTFWFLLIIPAAFVNGTHNTKSHWLDFQSPFQQCAQIWALVVQIQTLAPCLLPNTYLSNYIPLLPQPTPANTYMQFPTVHINPATQFQTFGNL